MPRRPSLPRVATAVAAALIAALALSACGSSSSTTASTSAAAGAGAGGPNGRPGFAALRQCLQRNGVNLPQRRAGAPPAGATGPQGPRGGAGRGIFGPGRGAGAPRFPLPAGVTRQKLQAALAKCGGGRFGRGGGFRNNPAFRKSLTAFAACMRQNGINLPAPNIGGTGPVFNTKGIDTRSAKFAAASTKCRSTLGGRFGRPPGAGAGAANGGPQTTTQ